MPVPTLITDLSTTAGNNSPVGGDVPSVLDDHARAHGAFIAQLRDGAAFSGTVSAPTAVRVGGATQGQLGTRVGGGGGVTASVSFDDAVIDSSTNAGVTVISGASSAGGFVFGDSGNSAVGGVRYNHATDQLALWAAGSSRITVDGTTNATTVDGGLIAASFFSTSSPIGFASGAGGTVTQATSKSTSVTLNKACGQITTANTSIASNAVASFTFNNLFIDSTAQVLFEVQSGAAAGASYVVEADNKGSGTCRVSIRNVTTGALAETLVLSFWVASLSNV
jgi:hypothetical protein